MSYARHARMHVHRRSCAGGCRRCERRTGTRLPPPHLRRRTPSEVLIRSAGFTP